jgi:hypothetical protein
VLNYSSWLKFSGSVVYGGFREDDHVTKGEVVKEGTPAGNDNTGW